MTGLDVTRAQISARGKRCDPLTCRRCVHAAAVKVTSSTTHVLCGCATGRNNGTWSNWFYYMDPPDPCPDFSEVVDPARKRMVNRAWALSCDRFCESRRARRGDSRPVPIGPSVFFQDRRAPFPEVECAQDGLEHCRNGDCCM